MYLEHERVYFLQHLSESVISLAENFRLKERQVLRRFLENEFLHRVHETLAIPLFTLSSLRRFDTDLMNFRNQVKMSQPIVKRCNRREVSSSCGSKEDGLEYLGIITLASYSPTKTVRDAPMQIPYISWYELSLSSSTASVLRWWLKT